MTKCFYCGDDIGGDAHKKLCLDWKKAKDKVTRGRPAKVIIIGDKPKKVYEIRITEREMEDGKYTGKSIHATTFQIKDLNGDSCIELIKVRLMAAFEKNQSG